MKEKMVEMKEFNFSIIGYLGLFTNLFLLISSYWFSYEKFLIQIMLVSIILIFGLYLKNTIQKISIIILAIFYIYFFLNNYNYLFVFGISLILGILLLQLKYEHLKVPGFIFTLIPLLILGHIIWFNTLPIGFEDNYRLDLGTSKDTSTKSELYLEDINQVLSPTQSYGDLTWREFDKDGTFKVNLNTPVKLENKTVQINMRYEATGPIYINNKLFYDPNWGSGIKYGNNEDQYIYGSKEFNLSYTNITSNEEYETIEDYIKINFPNGVLIEDFTGNYKELQKEMNSKYLQSINSVNYYPGWNQKNHIIKTNFRGPIEFYGIFHKSIDLTLLKQDLNLYNGSDSVEITIKDFNNNIIANKIIPDNDNILTRTTDESKWEKNTFSIPIEKQGIYKVEFKHEIYSEDPDFLIGNITFNSNKILINEEFQLWAPAILYNSNINNSVRVRYWWNGYEQIINLNDNKIFELTPELRGSWVELNLTDNSFIGFEKGKLIVDPKLNLAPFKNTNINIKLEGEKIIISKSLDLKKENIDLININELNITGTKGTKISRIDIKII